MIIKLGIWHRGHVVFVEHIGKPGDYAHYNHPGTALPALATALGKAPLDFRASPVVHWPVPGAAVGDLSTHKQWTLPLGGWL